jgi:hypothetical protein
MFDDIGEVSSSKLEVDENAKSAELAIERMVKNYNLIKKI